MTEDNTDKGGHGVEFKCYGCGKMFSSRETVNSGTTDYPLNLNFCSDNCQTDNDLRSLRQFLIDIGCKHRTCGDKNVCPEEWFILDGISTQYYIGFDLTDVSEEFPHTKGLCDVFVCHIGSSICESSLRIEVGECYHIREIIKLLDGLGLWDYKQNKVFTLNDKRRIHKKHA